MYPICLTASAALLSDNTSIHMQVRTVQAEIIAMAVVKELSRAVTSLWGEVGII